MALVAAVVAASALAITGLTAFSTAAEGPLTTVLGRVGAFVGMLEKRLSENVRTPGREAALAWFEAHRTDAAWLRRPSVTMLGAHDAQVRQTLEGVSSLERQLGTAFPLIHLYAAWGDKPDQRFPLREVSAIHELGSVPVVTWEPWLTDFESTLHPELPLRDARDRGGLAMIAAGMYDFYIDAWAAEAARFALPVLVRLGHEMNDPYRYPWGPHNNRAEEFVAAWRHVVARFRAAGAHNVLWVWSPHVAYPWVEHYYPGDEYVDWVATGALNYGTVAHWAQWYSFAEIYGQHHEVLASFGKPIMIAEFGSLAVGGDRAGWYRAALDSLPIRHPEVRALMFFNVPADQTVTLQHLDWSIENDSTVHAVVRRSFETWPPPGAADRPGGAGVLPGR